MIDRFNINPEDFLRFQRIRLETFARVSARTSVLESIGIEVDPANEIEPELTDTEFLVGFIEQITKSINIKS